MKKIGIVTIYDMGRFYNMGGQLQCCAMNKILDKENFCPQLIIYKNSENLSLLHLLIHIFKYKLKVIGYHIFRNYERQRVCNFEKFRRKHIMHSFIPIYKGISYKRLNRKYDYFIAGSDQVWNPNFFGDMYNQFLAFAPPEKKIAYAPSIGVSELTDKQLEMFKTYLKDFPVLSCREKAGAEILKGITGQDVSVVLDPTLLLTREEWAELENKPRFHKEEKYVFLYYLGNITEEYQTAIKNIQKELGCKVININDKNSVYYTCGPAEFVYLIHNAQIVLTDSFHACVFSTLFEKPFLAFERCDNVKSMNSRMDNLFDMLDLHDHKYTGLQDLNQIMHPNYTHTQELLEAERMKSKTFILNALKRN